MSKRRYDDPAFGDPRLARQDLIDREVESSDGPDSIPRRTSRPPETRGATGRPQPGNPGRQLDPFENTSGPSV